MNIFLSHRRDGNYIKTGELIRAYLFDWEKMDDFPKMNLIVPNDYDIIIEPAYRLGFLSDKKCSDIYCDIISHCSLLILFGKSDHSMQEEEQCAKDNHIPIFYMPQYDKNNIATLRYTIVLILKDNGLI